jgi:cell fate regulator YaaT (PSP1 superfamily)
MPISLEIMPLDTPPPAPEKPRTLVVRYGYLLAIGEFENTLDHKVGCGTKLVARTPRGTEIVEMLTTVCGNGGCGKSITRDKLLNYIANSGGDDYPFSNSGRILRVATPGDLAEQQKLDDQKPEHLRMARELATHYRLDMKIVEVEYLLGRERIIFYFHSEIRVDFRLMVRDLAGLVHARIDMRQVGARDEARLIADYEKCGQHCCCKQFLKVLTPISMKAAKTQKATLDTAKISGRCGRLMCCLRYEDETYEELKAKLPRRNSRVRTEAGEGWVLDGQILTQLVLVQYDDGKKVAVPMEQITAFNLPRPRLANGREMQYPGDGTAPPPPPGRDTRPGPSRGRGNGRGPGPTTNRPLRGPQGPRPPTNNQRFNGMPPQPNARPPQDGPPPGGEGRPPDRAGPSDEGK